MFLSSDALKVVFLVAGFSSTHCILVPGCWRHLTVLDASQVKEVEYQDNLIHRGIASAAVHCDKLLSTKQTF